MPVELGVWRISGELSRLDPNAMENETRLEDILERDIGIASPNWMVVGRQVPTSHGKFIDLLAMDRDGRLIVLELKKDRTPRDVVAQVLDYGSWVRTLEEDDIASIFNKYMENRHPGSDSPSLDDAFRSRFGNLNRPETLNESHELVVVASALDDSTERIVSYLADEHDVQINAVFFNVFKDGEHEYLTRAWFKDPTKAETTRSDSGEKAEWNGEYYASLAEDTMQKWNDARKYGFVSANGGAWYTRTLGLLEEGARFWVNIPGQGYVGVGRATGPVVKADQFFVESEDGSKKPICELPVEAPEMCKDIDDDEAALHMVPVEWIKTVPLEGAIKETGFFGNQNTVCKPTAKKWGFTVDRLKKRFKVE